MRNFERLENVQRQAARMNEGQGQIAFETRLGKLCLY